MNTETQFNEGKNRFSFQGITPDHDLEKDANLKLIQLLALAPPGAYAKAFVEWTGKSYFANVEIHSPIRSFSAQSLGIKPNSAVNKALEKLEDQIYRWRFGSGTGHFGSGSNTSQMGQLPWASSR